MTAPLSPQSPGGELSVDLGGSTLRSPERSTAKDLYRKTQRGRPARTAGRRSTVSIPSKFGYSEAGPPQDAKTGFGSSSMRTLPAQYRSDRPGPGAYKAPSALGRATASTSHKGSLTFASATGRFADSERTKREAAGTPGPGDYGRSPRKLVAIP